MTVPFESVMTVYDYLSAKALYDTSDAYKSGEDGTVKVDFVQEATPPTIVKTTYKDSNRTTPEATFEAGQTVYVELQVFEQGSSRSDFTLEDTYPTSATIDQTKFCLTPPNDTKCTAFSPTTIDTKNGIITIKSTGGSPIEFAQGTNKIWYQYQM